LTLTGLLMEGPVLRCELTWLYRSYIVTS